MKDTQIPKKFLDLIKEEEKIYATGTSITNVNKIPDTDAIPLDNPSVWMKVPDVICVFVDMKNSTKMSAGTNPQSTAAAYRLFTSTAVKIFHEVDAPYIDIKGDGVFALFNGDEPHKALAAAVTFKTFAVESFVPKIKEKTGTDVGVHVGIDCKTVLVRRLGLRRREGRTDRQNEVWAGKPVNMAAKLASLADENEIIVSDRYFKLLKNEKALNSCGCPRGEIQPLWHDLPLNDSKFDFDLAHKLGSSWCATHGAATCEDLLSHDSATEDSGRAGLRTSLVRKIFEEAASALD